MLTHLVPQKYLQGFGVLPDRNVIWQYDCAKRAWSEQPLPISKVCARKGFYSDEDEADLNRLIDVVSLYLDPSENAAVFSFDEKSQIQALDRTQPELPLKKGRLGSNARGGSSCTSRPRALRGSISSSASSPP